jgi:hypothetical protein
LGAIEASLQYMENNYPELTIFRNTNNIVFQGRFVISARHNNFSIQIAPLLELTIPYDYPKSLPTALDIDGVIDYDHKFMNGFLCLGTIIDIKSKLRFSECISDYIEFFLVPYFLNYEYWKKYKTDLFGDRSHGIDGVIESIQDFFNIPCNDPGKLLFLIAWASKKVKYRKLTKKMDKYILSRKYADKIGELRKLGMLRLKALYKLIEMCLQLPPEKLKNNEEYNKLYYLACS